MGWAVVRAVVVLPLSSVLASWPSWSLLCSVSHTQLRLCLRSTCSVDAQLIIIITSHMLPLPIQTIPILVWVLRHTTICENTFTLSSALHMWMDSTQHMYTYSASRSMAMHGANTICSFSLAICLSYSSMHSYYCSTCHFQLFHMLIALCYLSCFSPFHI